MEITKLEKAVNYNKNEVTLNVEIKLDSSDFAHFDYSGFDLVNDEMIPDILKTISKMYKVARGKLLKEKVRTII